MAVLWKTAGALLFALGAVGLALPVLPTTGFWILAVLCLAKAGDRRAALILDHPRVGPAIRLFLEQGVIARRAKLAALAGMGVGAAMLVPLAAPTPGLPGGDGHPVVAAAGWAVLALSALFVASRPEPRPVAARAHARRRPRS